jgi:hypothetical protein
MFVLFGCWNGVAHCLLDIPLCIHPRFPCTPTLAPNRAMIMIEIGKMREERRETSFVPRDP